MADSANTTLVSSSGEESFSRFVARCPEEPEGGVPNDREYNRLMRRLRKERWNAIEAKIKLMRATLDLGREFAASTTPSPIRSSRVSD
jgi:hypothetical protein